ncbi:hypothetical protein A3Q56_04055 [Intoshia linei]|uniref:Uncharacterized protein n=1 Tax=Intoshia linei TaxID=1819745 RepID=A0A177B1V3_9BILA|nr:hypothetical protein A3Q56_04055 [Intoshia linei]
MIPEKIELNRDKSSETEKLVSDTIKTENKVTCDKYDNSAFRLKDDLKDRKFRVILMSSLIFAFAVTISLIVSIFVNKPIIDGAVSSTSKVCSDIGLDLITRGGSAMDAVIGATLCETVVNPHSTSLGGSGFLIYHDKNEKTLSYDFNIMAPKNLNDQVLTQDGAILGNHSLSIGVPGMLLGFIEAQLDYGYLTWEEILKPIIKLARFGYNVTKSQEQIMQFVNYDSIICPHLKSMLFDENKEPFPAGTLRKRETYANFLEAFSKNPKKSFFTDEFAKALSKTSQNIGAMFTYSDFELYKVIKKNAIKSNYFDVTIYGCHPPCSSALVILAMKILSLYKDFNKKSLGEKLVIILKILRSTLSNTNKFDLKILEDKFAETAKESIDIVNFDWTNYKNDSTVASHVSAFDMYGGVASISTTLNSPFGAGVMTSLYGIILNDQLKQFDPPSFNNTDNKIESLKRPFSSLSPIYIYSENKACGQQISLGAYNIASNYGSNIISAVVQILQHLIYVNSTLRKTVADSLVFLVSKNRTLFINYEDLDDTTLAEIAKVFPNTAKLETPTTSINSVIYRNEKMIAYSDKRSFGEASVSSTFEKYQDLNVNNK